MSGTQLLLLPQSQSQFCMSESQYYFLFPSQTKTSSTTLSMYTAALTFNFMTLLFLGPSLTLRFHKDTENLVRNQALTLKSDSV